MHSRSGEHSKRVSAALSLLPEIDPAIAALALWCQYRDTNGSTATEGETIFVGPEFSLLPISEQTGLISHHILHVALRHSSRRASAQERYGARFQADLYDLACDAIINEALLQAKHALPRPAVRASEIVELLPASERPNNILSEWDSDKLYAVLAVQAGRQGHDAGGAVEIYANSRNFEPDLENTTPSSKKPEFWSGRVEQALQIGNRAGSGIGVALARFGDLPVATVPWEIRLRRLLAKTLSQHPVLSHKRPSKSWLAQDALSREREENGPGFEPAILRKVERASLVVAIDTSSSIDDATLDLFASEAISIIRRTGHEAYLFGFDTEVHSRHQLNGIGDLNRVNLLRDGGTDFCPMLKEAEALAPSAIIILTDLDAPTPNRSEIDIIWAVPVAPTSPPNCGTVLVMDDL
ncbi:Predicted metal-dependent peptidase [Cognatiyoonia sediminum]|uniref:Predicted metal-dependent peptidase n=1 Tax=Cognatiyoonia sediminum TaxID=1508389 RepID=A0A1M5S3I8_9RHOB|nr:Predicted metal-dependent peptidase [Cognatiyoonia sediminum]